MYIIIWGGGYCGQRTHHVRDLLDEIKSKQLICVDDLYRDVDIIDDAPYPKRYVDRMPRHKHINRKNHAVPGRRY